MTAVDTTYIPIIDLSGWFGNDSEDRAAVVDDVRKANESVGFLVITNHGVSPELIRKMHDVTEEFFALPDEAKMAVSQPRSNISRGYIPPRARSLGANIDPEEMPIGDLVEYFAAGPLDKDGDDVFFHKNIWPDAPDGFVEIWTEYYTALESLANELLQVFALALNLPQNYFEASCKDHFSTLFANGYPALKSKPEEGSVRLGQHTDYGSLTILYRDERPSGLQVKRGDSWEHVPDVEGSFVVNIGDLMQRWTNGEWVSTLHRVANPPVTHLDTRRLSIPFFHQPAPHAVIECLPTTLGDGAKFAPITSGENYLEKTQKTINKK